MEEKRATYADLKEDLLLTKEQIARRVQEMGRQITNDFEVNSYYCRCPNRRRDFIWEQFI